MSQNPSSLEMLLSQVKDISRDFSQIYGGLIRDVYQISDEVARLFEDYKQIVSEIDLLEEGGNVQALEESFQKEVGKSSDFFESNHALYMSYADQINKEIANLSNLSGTVDLMQETAIDMEIISINTLTVAVRAGKVGGAFSYITNEIKKLTQSMSSQAELLENRTQSISHALNLYEDKLQVIIQSELDIKEILATTLPAALREGEERNQRLHAGLSLIGEDFKKTTGFISTLVEGLQFQDTIAQALDNTSTVLVRYITDYTEKEDSTDTERLDYLLLKERLYKTSESILSDLKVRANENFENFRTTLKGMRQHMKGMLEHKGESDRAIRDQGFFRAALREVSALDEKLTFCFNLKQEFAKGFAYQIKGVLSLRQVFKGISLIINRFENISIASKIEVAKQKGLKDMEGNIREMTSLIMGISQDLSAGNDLISNFISAIERILFSYGQDFSKEERAYRHFQDLVHHFLGRFSRHFERVETQIYEYSLSSSFIDSYFHSIDSHLAESKSMITRVEEVNFAFTGLYLQAKENLQRGLRESDLKTWEFSSTAFADAMNHFKIYSYKMAMKKNLGREVIKDSVDEGDVILF